MMQTDPPLITARVWTIVALEKYLSQTWSLREIAHTYFLKIITCFGRLSQGTCSDHQTSYRCHLVTSPREESRLTLLALLLSLRFTRPCTQSRLRTKRSRSTFDGRLGSRSGQWLLVLRLLEAKVHENLLEVLGYLGRKLAVGVSTNAVGDDASKTHARTKMPQQWKDFSEKNDWSSWALPFNRLCPEKLCDPCANWMFSWGVVTEAVHAVAPKSQNDDRMRSMLEVSARQLASQSSHGRGYACPHNDIW